MPVRRDLKIILSVDDVIRGQGANPEIIRQRSPKLVEIAETAREEAETLIQHIVIYKELKVKSFSHNTLVLENGTSLSGDYVKDLLSRAEKIIIVACTISDKLQQKVSEIAGMDIVYALALDGAGSSAVESLSTSVCDELEKDATVQGMQTTVPINPGIIGWPVERGQKQIFDILKDESSEITINDIGIMNPFKSLSFIIGIGKDIQNSSSTCDLCTLRGSCIYHKNKETEEFSSSPH